MSGPGRRVDTAAAPLFAAHDLTANYGNFRALFGIDIDIRAGETIAIIGANGAGKSTLMRSLAGLIGNEPAAVSFEGREVGALAAPEMNKLGVALVPEGRKLFASLSVEENLLVGSHSSPGRDHWNLDSVYGLFPALRERHQQNPSTLSGGQQQMVAIGRALMANPKVLLCDEISLGLAPVVIRSIYELLPKICDLGTAIMIVEQDISQALKVVDKVYCLMEGRVTLSGRPSDLDQETIEAAYFGLDKAHGKTRKQAA